MARQADSQPSQTPLRDWPLKPLRTILDQEMAEAEVELIRPASGLLLSGVLAGIGVGFSVLLIAVIVTRLDAQTPELVREILLANAYTVGFILVILARTDLFTEYTTIAILPVLDGRAPVRRLARLWALVYVGNLIGTAAFAAVAVLAAPALNTADPSAFVEVAIRTLSHSWWVILLSSTLAGWLMGLLSWLIVSARETISQIFLIWLVAFVIGLTHLHHSVTGSAEVLAGLLLSHQISPGDYGFFLSWTTLGNIIGGVAFAWLVRSSALLGEARKDAGRSHPRTAADDEEADRL